MESARKDAGDSNTEDTEETQRYTEENQAGHSCLRPS
jgi:hypothetical protein